MQFVVHHRRNAQNNRMLMRAGITIMEVMFAIGVILIGLLGLAGLIPVAVRYAGETVRFDEAIQSGSSGSSLSRAQSIADFSRLRIFPTPMTHLDIGPTATTPGGNVDSPGFARTGRFAGFCIDPLATTLASLSPATTTYDLSVFPYYKSGWNLTSNPSDPSYSASVLTPRLWRCNLLRANGGTTPTPIDHATAQSIFSFPGDPLRQDLTDKSLFAARKFITGAATPLVPIASASKNRFSWFATLTPNIIPGPAYNLSTVIVEQRVPFISTLITPATRVEDNESSERLALVSGFIGFSGGAGGEITILGSEWISSKIRTGQWVMLSRQDYSGTVPVNPAQHAWYRVLAVSEPTASGTNWTSTLTLSGPDWDFGATTGTLTTGSTVCTIVEGAVEVIQTTVYMN